jgi:hypothetical protein
MIRGMYAKRTIGAAACAAVLALAGCGGFEANLPNADALAAGSAKTYDEFEKHWQKGENWWFGRNVVEPGARAKTIENAIAEYQRCWAIDPSEEKVYERLGIASYYLANYYTSSDEAKEKVYTDGRAWGEKGLLLDPDIKAATAEGKSFEDAVAAHAKPHHVPLIFWMATNWGRLAENKSIATRATTAPKLKSLMETCYRLGPNYYWGGPQRFFGVYFTKAPGQKDPGPDSKKQFDRAQEIGPEDLENKVLCAEYYATFVQDRALFEQLLREVIAAPEDYGPQALRLDNSEARKRAKGLLEKADDLF